MKHAYDAIIAAGLVLQLDCPDLAMRRHLATQPLAVEDFRRRLSLRVQAINQALGDIPRDRVRIHMCWGNYESPHHHDVPLADILDLVLGIEAGAFLFEAPTRATRSSRVRIAIRLIWWTYGCRSAAAHEPADGGHQLARLLVGVIGADDAVVGVVVQEAEGDVVQRGLGGGDLGEDVDAVAVFFDHALDAADLPLDAVQSRQQLVFGGAVATRGRGLGHGQMLHTGTPYGYIVMCMSGVLDVIWDGLKDSFLMAWEVWWALVLGFAISAIVQAWVPRERIEGALSGSGPKPIGWATGLGAASSSCSYAAVAIGKSLFQKGASAASALAFQFASTNLVWELGLVLWILIGWQFTVAEYIGGMVMIVLMTVMLRLFVSRQLEDEARVHAQEADTGHQHHAAGEQLSWRERLTSARAWSDVAHNFRGDWQMLWKEITIGFLLAGYIAQFGNGFFESLFIRDAPAPLPAIENVVIGPLIAVLSFVCSVGNVPLAAVLWSGGISFAGVLAFLFADLIVLPIIAIYRKYYGSAYALRITALMFVTMAIAGLVVDGLFSGAGLIPTDRPSRADIFGSIDVDYKLFLNILGVVAFAALFWLTARRGATDPVCGMKVDRAKAVTKDFGGQAFYFCSAHCLHSFEADPEHYLSGEPGVAVHEHHAANG
jgi:uncharacterized membrane protein YraQ (UPF0718 family)/YHS domain-containing protein